MKQCLDSATFWINKIRREAHDRMDKKPQEWCTAVITMLKELITLITEHFPEGFKWNEKGVSVADAPATACCPCPYCYCYCACGADAGQGGPSEGGGRVCEE